jgi:integrase
MPRTPKPWWRKERKAWFVMIGGKQHNLGSDREAAFRKFHELMSQPRKRTIASDSVVAVIDLFLDWVSKHRASDTYEWYRQRLQGFATAIGPGLKVRDLRPFHVQEFIDAMPHSSGTKRNYVRAVKRATRWAKKQGYIDENPIADMEKPKAGKRETVVSEEDFERILSLVPDPAFRDLLIVTYRSGCRPQESLRVEARHVDLANSRWVFPETEEKNETLYRVVYLSEEAIEITKRLMARYPSGKLFRNSRGIPWSTDAANCAFVRIQVRMGRQIMKEQGIEIPDKEIKSFMKTLKPEAVIGGTLRAKRKAELRHEAKTKLTKRKACSLATKYSLYVLRHSWSTHALKKGVDPLTVAILMGHKDPSTLSRVYQHVALSPSHMLSQARKAAG